MVRTLIYPSSGACDYAVELPHRSFCSRFVVCWRFGAAVFDSVRVAGWSTSFSSACNTDTTQTQPHQISNTQRTENKTTNVVIQQHSRKLLMMDILMSETCWVHVCMYVGFKTLFYVVRRLDSTASYLPTGLHKKWNKTASDIKLVFYSSSITMMHGPINIKFLQSIVYISLHIIS